MSISDIGLGSSKASPIRTLPSSHSQSQTLSPSVSHPTTTRSLSNRVYDEEEEEEDVGEERGLDITDAEVNPRDSGESSRSANENANANASVIDGEAGRMYRGVLEHARGGYEVEGARLDDIEDDGEFRIEEVKVSDAREFISEPVQDTKIAPVVNGLRSKQVPTPTLWTSKPESALTEKTFVAEVSPASTNASHAYTNVDADSELGMGRQTGDAVAIEHDERTWTYTMDNKPTWKKVTLVLVCTMGMIINIASTTAVTISLPVIGREFGAQQGQLQWLVSAFALSSGCLLILSGRLADLYGKKRAFLLGISWLGIFSIACGAVTTRANNLLILDILRGVQGIGPAAYIPASIGILAQAFPPSRARAIAFSTFSAGAPIGGAVGQQLGGVLVQYTKATWRAPFFLMAGLAALTFAGGCLVIENDHIHLHSGPGSGENAEEEDRRVDWLGALLVSSGLILITFALGQGQLAPMQWRTPYILALLILGIFLLLAFGFWQHHLEKNAGNITLPPPLMKLSLWTRANGKFATVQMIAFLEWASYISWGFWALLYYQDFLNISPVLSAVRLLPTAIVGLAANAIVALVIGRLDMLYLVVFGTLMTSLAGLLFAVINPATTYWAFDFPAACASVFGVDFVFASGTLFIAKVSNPSEQSLAGGLFQTLTQLGTALGLAITTIINGRVLQDQSQKLGVTLLPDQSNAPRDAQLKAYQAAQWGVFAFAALGTILAIVFLRGVGVVGEEKQKQKRKHGSMLNLDILPVPDSRSETTVVTIPQTPRAPAKARSFKFNNKIAITTAHSSTDEQYAMDAIQNERYMDANTRWLSC